MYDVKIQVRLGRNLYTYAIRADSDDVVAPGDIVAIPAPWWTPGSGEDHVEVVHVGAECADTGYSGPVKYGRLIKRAGERKDGAL